MDETPSGCCASDRLLRKEIASGRRAFLGGELRALPLTASVV